MEDEEWIPLDTVGRNYIIIDYDKRRVEIRQYVGDANDEKAWNIGEAIARELHGYVGTGEYNQSVYVYVPWLPDIYYTFLGEIEDIRRMIKGYR